MKSYLLILNNEPEENEMRHFLNARDEITDWIAINTLVILFRGTMVDESDFSDSLNSFLKRNSPTETRSGFIVGLVEYSPSFPNTPGVMRGWMPRAAWSTYAKWAGYELTWNSDGLATSKPARSQLPSSNS